MKNLIITFSLVFLTVNVNIAQELDRETMYEYFIKYEYCGINDIFHEFTNEVIEATPHITDCSAIIKGDFEDTVLFGKSDTIRGYRGCVGYRGVPYFFYVNKGDVVSIACDMDFPNEIRTKYKAEYEVTTRTLSYIINDEEIAVDYFIAKNPLYISPNRKCVAFINHQIDGYFVHDISPIFLPETEYHTNYTIWLNRYGKLESVTFSIDDGVSFNVSDVYDTIYKLLSHVHVKAKDIYGNDVPILNSLSSQWEIDRETGIAHFTPILYPFSSIIEGVEDAYEMDTNKSASTEEDNDIGITGVTLDNCMKLEAVNPDILLFDLNKSGTVTHVVNVNASASQADVWYSLAGQRLQGKPAEKGVYIHNGKKEVVK